MSPWVEIVFMCGATEEEQRVVQEAGDILSYEGQQSLASQTGRYMDPASDSHPENSYTQIAHEAPNCAIISKMVSTYIQSSAPADASALAKLDDVNHKTFINQLVSSDIIYNLSDVEKFLPKIEENANDEDFCGETLTRKRKDRHDSGSFSAHECKVTRSNSEERTVEVKIISEDNIRRVSSHEDFEKYKKPLGCAQAAPLYEQNDENNYLPLRAHNRLELNNDNVKDINKTAPLGEKFSRFSVQDIDNENSLDYYNVRQKYSKNDSSPSRSSIHEYILFPKRISPHRDPNALARDRMCGLGGAGGDGWEMDSEAEKARSSERRSRTRRAPQRRQPKLHVPNNHSIYSGFLKENDLMSLDEDGVNKILKTKKYNLSDRESSSLLKFDTQNNVNSKERDKSKGKYERIYDEENKDYHQEDENDRTTQNFIDFTSKTDSYKKMRDRSQSPIVHSISPLKQTPLVDLKTLHQQVVQDQPVPSVPIKFSDFPNDTESFENLYNFLDDSEPLLDDNIAGYSREISEIQNQKRILPEQCDYGVIETIGGNMIVEPDERLNRITKKIQTLKKKIAKCEIEFELLNGFRASHSDKMSNTTLRKLYSEVRKLKYEKKSIKKGPSESMLRTMSMVSNEEQSLKTKPISEIVSEIERRLEAKRNAHGRPEQLEQCSRAQLLEEKAAVQRALLWLEGARGRPSSRPDRDTARPLYDRYRVVKRLVAGFDAMKLSNNVGELATIMENEALPFTSSESPIESPESVDKCSSSDAENKDSSSDNKEIDEGASSSAKSTVSDQATAPVDEKKDIINENLHCLSLDELNKLLLEAKALKLSLRTSIKSMEADYEELNGRKMTKDDKESILQTYAKYKETKARVRLLTALVNKQKKNY